jgi:hypothetical protein
MKPLERRTVEEAAGKYANSFTEDDGTTEVDFIEGAKWKAERMYSEEEVLELLLKSKIETSNLYYEDMKEWFEQFKKK